VELEEAKDLLFFGVIGVVVGGRLGYVLFYKLGYYLSNPLEIIAVWKGGMSFHGGMLGVLIAMALFASRRNRAFYEVCDLIAPCVPTGLAMGRLGNFINGELWGRLANPNLPWSMVFPDSGTLAPRHPSQIYELLLEGILLFVILWLYARRKSAYTGVRGQAVWGKVSGAFLVLYGVFRFISEYFREPDAFLGLLQLGLSMGQWLSLPMVLMGAIIFWVASHRGNVGKVPSS
jgi:phosphatidylglycerol:prolipoprotein diacylglycerol transferase